MKEFVEKLIERLEEKKFSHTQFDGVMPEEIDAVSIGAIKKIVNQLAEEYKGGWIPCSERLPEEEYDTVLAVTNKKHYAVYVYTTEHGFRTMDIDADGEVIAWMPLPPMYESKGE